MQGLHKAHMYLHKHMYVPQVLHALLMKYKCRLVALVLQTSTGHGPQAQL